MFSPVRQHTATALDRDNQFSGYKLTACRRVDVGVIVMLVN